MEVVSLRRNEMMFDVEDLSAKSRMIIDNDLMMSEQIPATYR